MSLPAVLPEASVLFASRQSVEQVEEGRVLAPKFDGDGLIPVVTSDTASGEVLMLGHMNVEALLRTISSGEAHYWSRSRAAIWHKGATCGLVQRVVEVAGSGASCHVGYRSCFYRAVPLGALVEGSPRLQFTETVKIFNPVEVYGDAPNPTQL